MLLEVQLQDLLLRPCSQIEPPNLCDIFALNECSDAPEKIRIRVQNFIERSREELAEMADGSQMKTFVEEMKEIEPSRIPASYRVFLLELAEREGRDGALLNDLLAGLAEHEPEPFEIGSTTVRVQRAAEVNPEASRARFPKGSGVPGVKAPPKKRKAAVKKEKVVKVVDIERQNWIRNTVIERLSGVSESGLGEKVLIAGIRHRARANYPRLGPHEVIAVLNDLLKKGVVRKSAGRWSRP